MPSSLPKITLIGDGFFLQSLGLIPKDEASSFNTVGSRGKINYIMVPRLENKKKSQESIIQNWYTLDF